MADDAPRALQCLIEGESLLFKVTATGSLDMMDLKRLIKEERKNGMLKNVDAADLMLWKVRMTSAVIRSDITGDTTLAYGGYPYQAS